MVLAWIRWEWVRILCQGIRWRSDVLQGCVGMRSYERITIQISVKKVIFLRFTLGIEEDYGRPEGSPSLNAAENSMRLTHSVQYLLTNCAVFRVFETA